MFVCKSNLLFLWYLLFNKKIRVSIPPHFGKKKIDLQTNFISLESIWNVWEAIFIVASHSYVVQSTTRVVHGTWIFIHEHINFWSQTFQAVAGSITLTIDTRVERLVVSWGENVWLCNENQLYDSSNASMDHKWLPCLQDAIRIDYTRKVILSI